MAAPAEMPPVLTPLRRRKIADCYLGLLLDDTKFPRCEEIKLTGQIITLEGIQNELAKATKAQIPEELVTQLGFDNPQVQWWKVKNSLTDFYFAVPKDTPPGRQRALKIIELANRSIAAQNKDRIEPELLTTGLTYDDQASNNKKRIYGRKEPMFIRFSGIVKSKGIGNRAVGIEYDLQDESNAARMNLSLAKHEEFERLRKQQIPTPVKYPYALHVKFPYATYITAGVITKAMQEMTDSSDPHDRCVIFSLQKVLEEYDYNNGNVLFYHPNQTDHKVLLHEPTRGNFELTVPPQLPKVR